MPEKSHRDNNGKSVQSIDPHQSSWLTHWTKTRFDSSTHEPSTHRDLDIKKHIPGVEIASDNFQSSKRSNDLDLSMSLNKPGTQSFPFFKRSQESKMQALLEPQVSHKNSSRQHHFQPEILASSQIPTEQVKYHMFFGESSYYCPNPNSVPMGEPQELKREKTEMPSFPRHQNHPSTSNSPNFLEEQYKRMQKHIGMGFFPHQNQEMNKSFQNFPHFVHDVEMTGGVHGFSRTTHSLLITKQTDVELYQEKQIFREVNCSQPNFGHGQGGVKLQLLDSDQESQEKIEKNAEFVQKNESSADTDTMDMEAFKENRLSGLHLPPQNKDTTVESNSPFHPPTTTKEKDARRKRKIKLPDINIEISNPPSSSSSSTQKTDPTTSRTQSLDMTTLQYNIKDDCSDSTTNPDSHPGNRWIKRLKLTSKPPKLLDQFHHKRSEIQIGEPSSSKPKQCDEITLSHSWIQRWSHDQGRKSVEAVGNCKPENPKLTAAVAEDYQKKQFPSIAAMALMGKAMTGFQQCKFQKKDSFVVWNTKGFE